MRKRNKIFSEIYIYGFLEAKFMSGPLNKILSRT